MQILQSNLFTSYRLIASLEYMARKHWNLINTKVKGLKMSTFLRDFILKTKCLLEKKRSFRFECQSNFNVFFFIPKYLFRCGKPKNENYFVEKLFINT